ncbi:MAG: hypothetical protein V2A71_06430 [Candidatus Eisenbacteria bacterium]
MRLRERRRPFEGRSGRRLRETRFSGRLRPRGLTREQLVVSKVVSLSVLLLLIGMLAYALYKFAGMLRARGFELSALWFVPTLILAVLFFLGRSARSLLRDITRKPSAH